MEINCFLLYIFVVKGSTYSKTDKIAFKIIIYFLLVRNYFVASYYFWQLFSKLSVELLFNMFCERL